MSIDVVSAYGLDTTGTKDNSAALQKWANAVVAVTGPQPHYVFDSGVIAYSAWPTFIVPRHFQMSADGQCVLKCTGTGDAVTLTGASNDSTWRTVFDGFTVVPYGGGRGIVTWHLHDSTVNATVPGTVNQNCVHVYFSVLSRFGLTLGNGNDMAQWMPVGAKPTNGLVLDAWNGQANGQTSKCAIYSPNISNCAASGILIQNGGMNDIWGGSSEGNGVGYMIVTGGANVAHAVDFESNSNQDIIFESGAHNNALDTCTWQKAPQLGNFFNFNIAK